ncbi:MAG: bifunctional riboflavin kinase/FAD synthetase, partial [Fidelibacterota bacterium]
MDTFYRLRDLPPLANTALTVGTFDGLHRGHLAVIQRLMNFTADKSTPSVVLTFDPHPQHVLAPPEAPKKELIITLEKKLSILEAAGVDLTMLLTFDKELSRISANEFLEKVIVEHFQPKQIVVGYDHHFGYKRQGNAQFLTEHAPRYGYSVEVVEAVNSTDSTISSSQIRQLLKNGQCEEAEYILGRPYEIPGKVIPGTGRGGELEYPTANLAPDEPAQLIPKGGVYIISATIDSRETFGMCNVGFRPTFNGKTMTIEAHFFNPVRSELYNARLAFRFHHRLRSEHKFSTTEELRAQLERDKESSLKWIAKYQEEGKQIHASIS